jgi:hypothetical protein
MTALAPYPAASDIFLTFFQYFAIILRLRKKNGRLAIHRQAPPCLQAGKF